MSYEVYEEDDSVLSKITLPEPCGVRVEITDESVKLHIGPRDWSWDRKTGVLIGCGTEINLPAEDEELPQ
jgi:hypothetical protein